MSRAHADKTQRRHRQINFRVTDDDRARLSVDAVRAGLKLPAYCEMLVMRGRVELAPTTVHRMEPALFAELRRIGNNLNQVAHATNSGLPPHVGDTVKALRDLLHALLRDDLLRRRIDGLNKGG